MRKPQTISIPTSIARAEVTEEVSSVTQASDAIIDSGAIGKRAYELWLERGCPEGSPEEDWYSAEKELRAMSPVEKTRDTPRRRSRH